MTRKMMKVKFNYFKQKLQLLNKQKYKIHLLFKLNRTIKMNKQMMIKQIYN